MILATAVVNFLIKAQHDVHSKDAATFFFLSPVVAAQQTSLLAVSSVSLHHFIHWLPVVVRNGL